MDNPSNQEVKAPKKGSLMIVDDEVSVLKTLEKLLSSHYEIITAESGEKALELIQGGARPDVIMRDQVMPGMNGAEFLDKTCSICSDSVRVILTGNSSPKDIIMAINQAHAYMFLTKPWDNVQLIQAIRLCFDHHNLHTQNKILTQKLNQSVAQKEIKENEEKQNKQQANVQQDDMTTISQVANAISQLVISNENWYFTPHTTNVAIIAKEVGKEAALNPIAQNNLLIAALLHNIIIVGMPIKYQLCDPDELSDHDRSEYFKYFNNKIVSLSKISKLQKITSIISTLWERHDGSGYPLSLSGMQITRESQILAMANIFHNKIYRISLEDYNKSKSRGVFVQLSEQTQERHNEAIKYFYRHAAWFDVDLANIFHNLIKKKSVKPLLPIAGNLEFRTDNEGSRIFSTNDNAQNSAKKLVEVESENIKEHEENSAPRLVEKEIPVESLQAGMVVGQNVLTKAGILIVRQDAVLDAAHVRNIKSASINGMFSKNILIMSPATKTI